MITTSELTEAKLSATKKDYYQIWNELLEIAKKISNRWDPTCTNESDPGIVLLKVLTGVADKLNYNIDKNILEAFMPSAAQMESMRKLCDVLGYNMKYYQSATTTVTVSFKNGATNVWPNQNGEPVANLFMPIFTTFSDANNNIHYVTTASASVLKTYGAEIPVTEGQLVQCTSENDNIISVNQLDDNNRYYLPETQIAENGIFIQNYNNGSWSEFWSKVDNLNGIQLNRRVFKFGYDSSLGYPYIQFPDDIAQIIEDGLSIYYIRTSGVAGNISANTLVSFNKPSNWDSYDEDTPVNIERDFIVTNKSATLNGANKESIESAYNNFKKTIGTFDTLVTCRDYMNKIYQLMDDENNPLVSNIIVSDIRDDINRSRLLCTYGAQGINYLEDSKIDVSTKTAKINNFNLMLYPFTAVRGLNSLRDYINSFKISNDNLMEIKNQINNIKTISHQFVSPNDDELALIKVYMQLYVSIITNSKVNAIEQKEIINNVKNALYTEFNLRNLDFGEEIPTEKILDTIQYADNRIKTIYLQSTPKLIVKYLPFGSTTEYSVNDTDANGRIFYNMTTLRNILAGRVEMFNYNTDFAYNFDEQAYNDTRTGTAKIAPLYPNDDYKIKYLKPSCTITLPTTIISNEVTLSDNEVISFRSPNLNTIITYPAYVNYYFVSNNTIEANTDYKLSAGEYLYINYTEKLTDDSSVIKNIFYTDGAIIRPNFTLSPSSTNGTKVINSTTFYKYTENGVATNTDKTYPSAEAGSIKFYTLDTSEQIELRKLAKVSFTGNATNQTKLPVYWVSPQYNEELPWEASAGNTYKYMLQDGEYFYYTDSNYTDMAWYGSGTEIIFKNIDPSMTIKKSQDELLIDADNILSNGLAAIPWKEIVLNDQNKTIELQEYQYLNLVSNDTLNSITFVDTSTSVHVLNTDWAKINDASYTLAGYDSPTQLPSISINTIKWEVRSSLDMNIGPNIPQTLRHNNIFDDKIEIFESYPSSSSVTAKATINPENGKPVTLKSNYVAQSSRLIVDTSVNTYNLATGTTTAVDDFKIKAYTAGGFKSYIYTGSAHIETDISSNIHNAGDKWTRLQFGTLLKYDGKVNKQSYFKLSINLPDDTYGLIMLYNPTTHTNKQDNPYITFTPSGSGSTAHPEIFNIANAPATLGDTSTGWWTNHKTNNNYYLRQSINIIKITKSGTLQIYPDNTAQSDPDKVGQTSITFSDLDVINVTNTTNNPEGINLDLIGYKQVNATTQPAAQLLEDIANTDLEYMFYYNCPIDNSYAINLSNNYKLDSPEILFDKNNLNNKFVVAEIDAEHLDIGITIDRGSKL